MINFRLITDMALATEAITSPHNLIWGCPDDMDMSNFQAIMAPTLSYVGCYDDETFLGCVVVVKVSDEVGEVHIAFLPNAFGKTYRICKKYATWIRANLGYKVLLTSCVPENVLATKLTLAVGFKQYDVLENYWLKDGKYYNMNQYQLCEGI